MIILYLGVTCMCMTPVLILVSFVLQLRMGRAISRINAALWDEMKPGMYSDIGTSRGHRENLLLFLSTKEYLSLNDASVTKYAVAYRVVRLLWMILLCVSIGFVIWVMN